MRARLRKDELLTRIDVGPLSRDATEALVLDVLGQDVPMSSLDRIWRLSRGNALFVRELLTAYRDAMQYIHDQTYRLMARGLTPDELVEELGELPPGLRELRGLHHATLVSPPREPASAAAPTRAATSAADARPAGRR